MSKEDSSKGPRDRTSSQAKTSVEGPLSDDKHSNVGQLEMQTKVAGWDTLKTFCETTTFHGLRNVAEPNFHVVRR